MRPRDVTHVVKIDLYWWNEIAAGRKTAELRLDDRDYQVGDRLRFIVLGSSYGERTITHVLKNAEQFGLRPGYVMLSLSNPDYDWQVETAERRREWLDTAEARIRSLKGVITKQRKVIQQLKGGAA